MVRYDSTMTHCSGTLYSTVVHYTVHYTVHCIEHQVPCTLYSYSCTVHLYDSYDLVVSKAHNTYTDTDNKSVHSKSNRWFRTIPKPVQHQGARNGCSLVGSACSNRSNPVKSFGVQSSAHLPTLNTLDRLGQKKPATRWIIKDKGN